MDWYEDEIKLLEEKIGTLQHQPTSIFYGSSSIRQWNTLELDLPQYDPFNVGFGGSTMAACNWYFERLFSKLLPRAILIYAGDNDLGDGGTPENVFEHFKFLANKIINKYGNIPIAFISIKPSICRADILDRIIKTNEIIKTEILSHGNNLNYINVFDYMLNEAGQPDQQYFLPDGLHINTKGYELWKNIITEQFPVNNIY